MPKNGRPPMKAAREYATKQVVAENPVAFEEHVQDYLAERGWGQTTETVTRWVNNGATAPEGSN